MTIRRVWRNDQIEAGKLAELNPSHVVISPGPGRPEKAGITQAVIQKLSGLRPILGVCLGHQAVGNVFGGRVVHAPRLMHGKTSLIFHDGQGVIDFHIKT